MESHFAHQPSYLPSLKPADVAAAEFKLRAERRRHREALDQKDQQIANLQAQLDVATQNFVHVNKRLNIMLPTPRASDRTIANAYDELCLSIELWVESKSAAAEDLAQRIKSGWMKESSSTAQQIFEQLSVDEAIFDTVLEQPQCGEHLLSKIIMRFLFETLLRQARWLPGMSFEQERIFQLALDGFLTAFPNKDCELREAWRHDAYTSLLASAELKNAGNVHLKDLSKELFDIVAAFIHTDKVNLDKDALTTIVYMAADLANTMRLCCAQYFLVYNFAPQMSAERRQISGTALANSDFINVSAPDTARVTASTSSDGIELAGEILCTVFPTLVKSSPKSLVKLVKGLALADIHTYRKQAETKENRDLTHENNMSQAEGGKVIKMEKLDAAFVSSKPAEAKKTWANVASK